MPLYNIEVTARYTIVVSADNDDNAISVASENWVEGLQYTAPDPKLDIRDEVKTESNLLDDWDVNCLPYGGDGKTCIGDILSNQKLTKPPTTLQSESIIRCGNNNCFVHDGETCAKGEMRYVECAMYKQMLTGKPHTKE